MKILESALLESIVYLVPYGNEYAVYIQSIPILRTRDAKRAVQEVKDIQQAVIRVLKERILESAPRICRLCKPGQMPVKYKTKHGTRLLHEDPSLGWQPCEAETLYQALMDDTKERIQDESNHDDEM